MVALTSVSILTSPTPFQCKTLKSCYITNIKVKQLKEAEKTNNNKRKAVIFLVCSLTLKLSVYNKCNLFGLYSVTGC